MELDRGQADAAAVLSVGVHTSPCTAPGPDPITQARLLTVTSPTSEDAVAAPLRLCGTLIFLEFGCDGDTVGVIYDSLRAPADYVWRNESERKGGSFLKSCAAVNYFPFDSLLSLQTKNGWRVCVYKSVCGMHSRGSRGGSETMGAS